MKLFRRPNLPRQRLRSANQALPTSFSYHARRAEQEDNVGRQLERPIASSHPRSAASYWRHLSLIGLSIVILFGVIDLLSLSSTAMVRVLSSSQNQPLLRSQADYQMAVNQLLAGSLWDRNKITIDTSGLSHQLIAKFPELSGASISWPLFGHRPIVYLQPLQPGLVIAANNGAFIIDSQGKAVLQTAGPADLVSTKLPVITDDSSLALRVGHQALPSDEVSFIQTVVAQFTAKQIPIAAMNLPPAVSELDVHITGVNYYIKFNLANNDARQQVGTFLATKAQLQRQNVTPGQYIDVRVDGRAYYK